MTKDENLNLFEHTDEIPADVLKSLLEACGLYGEYLEWKEAKAKIDAELANLGKDMVEIRVEIETPKAYGVAVGSNGLVGRGCRVFYNWVPKSRCKVIDGRVFAPFWALK